MDEITGKTGSAASNRTTTVLLAVIAVLLVAVAVIVYVNRGGSGGAKAPVATAPGATTGMPSGMGGGTVPGTDLPFDPKTATKVAAGKSPEDHVKEYFDAVVAGDFAKAYALLPTSNQAKYGNEKAFSDQLKGYNIKSYTIDDVTEADGETKVTATATMAGGSFQYVFSFVKEGDTWLAKSRALPGMSN